MLYLFNNDSHDTQPSTICTQEMGQQNQILTSVNIHVDFYNHVKNSKNGGPLRVFYGIFQNEKNIYIPLSFGMGVQIK